MGKQPTRERILREGLLLFARKGYGAVSVEEIAAAVGIKAPSLYKHFAGKREIFETIVGEMKARHLQTMREMQMRGGAEQDIAMFVHIGEAQLVDIGKRLFEYFLHDEAFSNLRKMLTLSQYADAEIAGLLADQCMSGPLKYNEQLFGLMMEAGAFIPGPPKVMALQFYAPIYLLLLQCDISPELETESKRTLEGHIRQFHHLYAVMKENAI